MAGHRFTVGQAVHFSPDRRDDGSARGRYTIVRLLPEEGSTPQYRIKSKTDGHEREVRETQLERRTAYIAFVLPSRRPPRGLLRMTLFLNAITDLPSS